MLCATSRAFGFFVLACYLALLGQGCAKKQGREQEGGFEGVYATPDGPRAIELDFRDSGTVYIKQGQTLTPSKYKKDGDRLIIEVFGSGYDVMEITGKELVWYNGDERVRFTRKRK
jgi:hypothetical protein